MSEDGNCVTKSGHEKGIQPIESKHHSGKTPRGDTLRIRDNNASKDQKAIRRTPRTGLDRTIARHENGISAAERQRFVAGVRWMAGGRMRLFFYSVAAHQDSETCIAVIDDFHRQLSIEARRAGMSAAIWAEAHHGTPSRHAHGIAAFPDGEGRRRLKAMQARKTFTQYDRPDQDKGGQTLHVRTIDNLDRAIGYALEEMAPEAAFQGDHQPRLPRRRGSHPVDGGGDRVRLAPALESELLAAGRLQPVAKTYTKRASKAAKVRPDVETVSRHNVRASNPVTFETDLFGGLPELIAPPKPTQTKAARITREKVYSDQAELKLGAQIFDLAAEAMKRLHVNKTELAKRLGVSRPHLSNVIAGRFSSETIGRQLVALTGVAA